MSKSNFTVKTEKNKTEVVLNIKLSKEGKEKYYQKAVKEISQNLNIDGFRKGHAPANLVEAKVGKTTVLAHALDLALPETYSEAVKAEKIEPIAMPKVEIDSLEDMSYKATCAIMPEVEVKGMDKIKVEIKAPKVTKKDIDQELESIQKQSTEWKEVKRKAKKEDRVEINFAGFDKDENPIPNTESKNYPLVLGSGVFIPGFEENIEGMAKDEEKSFQVTFPKDYHADTLKGAEVTFKVKVNMIEEPQTPEINDELIQKHTNSKKTLEEYKKEIKAKIEKQKEHQALHEAENQVFDELVKAANFDVSDILIQEEFKILKQEIDADLKRRGQTFEAYEKNLQETEGKTFEEQFKEKAEERVKLRFIVDHVVKTKDLEVTDKELDAEIKQKAEEADESIKKHVKDYYEQNPNAKQQLKQHMLMDKLIKLFTNKK
jgi:trigger factor